MYSSSERGRTWARETGFEKRYIFWTKGEGCACGCQGARLLALQVEKGKGGDGGIVGRGAVLWCKRSSRLCSPLIAAQVRTRSKDGSLERNHELLEWLPEDDKSEQGSDAQFWEWGKERMADGSVEDCFRIVSFIIAKYCPSPNVTPVSCPQCDA